MCVSGTRRRVPSRGSWANMPRRYFRAPLAMWSPVRGTIYGSADTDTAYYQLHIPTTKSSLIWPRQQYQTNEVHYSAEADVSPKTSKDIARVQTAMQIATGIIVFQKLVVELLDQWRFYGRGLQNFGWPIVWSHFSYVELIARAQLI